MNCYETLLDEACVEGLTVKEKPLKYNNGRIKGNRIAIRQDIETTTEKACVLAEELGHHYTTVGNIVELDTPDKRKQERQARLYGYDCMIGLSGLIDAYEHGCQNRHEVAEYLEVTEEFLSDCIECYRQKYGVSVTVGKHCIIFIPNLTIGRIE